jgi:Ca2+-binding RTX toxin-like protein
MLRAWYALAEARMNRDQGRRLSLLGFLAIALLLILAPTASAVVTSNFSNGFLSVTSDAGDAIAITCVGGNVKVNGGDPGSGAVACSLIGGIFVGGGPGANTIDLSGVTQADFPNILPSVGIFGGPGADEITGSEFSDVIDGGPGSDTIAGGGEADNLQFSGSPAADTITATAGAGLLMAGGETDTYTGIESFWLSGLAGDDTLTGAGGNDFLGGGGGNDTLSGAGGADFLDGGTGEDTLDAGDGDDFLAGDPFNPFNGQEAADTLKGGAGAAGLSFAGAPGNDELIATAPDGSFTAGGLTDTYTGIERFSLFGFAGDDTLIGAGGNDSLGGGDGNDTLAGAGGDDILGGGGGNDAISGGPGNDLLVGEIAGGTPEAPPNDDQLDGGAGNDLLLPRQGSDIVRGGPGNDVIEEDLFGVENDNWDGQEGSDSYGIAFGSGTTAKTMTVADSGPAADTDDLTVFDCTGVTRTSTEVRKGAEVITFSGIEVSPCPFAPPPPPPPGPPPPPPPPGPPPPGPPPPSPPPPPPAPPAPQLRCVVPNVKGKTLARARRLLASRRCVLGRVTKAYSQKVRKGRVISQRPSVGRRLPRGTKVHVKVSRGRRPPS